MRIQQLMDVPEIDRDVAWLKLSLQWAVELELSTIPPYLCAMWSIVDVNDSVRNDIRRIVLDEMLHMGLACNMLTTLGGTPSITTAAAALRYPGHLPGGVRPELLVWLAGFSRSMVRSVYMEIEYPENGTIAHFLDQTYPTIGAFYSAILAAFMSLEPGDFKQERQLTEPILGLSPILSKNDAENAIKLIKEQGEGTTQDPFSSGDPKSRAHYYRFAELYYGRRLIKVGEKWEYSGAPVRLPNSYPMAEVPLEGYAESRPFDLVYTSVVNDLQSAWESGNQLALDSAIDTMRDSLEGPAVDLMKKPLPSGYGNFGPSFKFIPKG